MYERKSKILTKKCILKKLQAILSTTKINLEDNMKRNRVWLIAVVLGIMLITSVFYVTSRNARVEYVNGRMVERNTDKPDDTNMAAFSFTHGKLYD